MNDVIPLDPAVDMTVILDAMPIGVAIFDAEQRLVMMNGAYYASLSMPKGTFPPGTTLEETMRQAAQRGVFGPGEPETQVRQQMLVDRSRAGRLRRRRFNGRIYDLHNTPLPGGGHLVNAVEISSLVNAREDAENVANKAMGAVATLRFGLAAFAPDATLVLFNPRFTELMGIPPGLLSPGLAFLDLLHAMRGAEEYAGNDGERFLTAQARMDRRQPRNERRLRGNGQVIDIASDPLPNGGWTITASDISALAHAEQDSQRRITMLDALMESIPHGICVYGPDKRLRMFNRAYAQVMAGAEVAIGEHFDEVIRRRDAAGEYGPDGIAAILHTPESRDYTHAQVRRRRQRPNGTVIDVRSAPLPDGGHVSVVTDVTQLAMAEVELTRRASEMEAMFAHTRHGLTLWSVKKRLIAANSMSAELLEVPPGSLVPGLTLNALLLSMKARGAFGDEQQAEDYVQAALANDPTQPWRSELLTASGRILDVRSTPTKPGGFTVVTFTDITDTRRVEQELREAVATANEAQTAKARFLATMSHELRTPLNSVIGFSDTLIRDRGTTEPSLVREFAEDINLAGKRLLLLINNMLDVARIEAGRFDLATDLIDVPRIIEASIRLQRSFAIAGEVDVYSEVQDKLPMIRGDERRMQQVITNLLSNSIKFGEPGGTATITAELEASGDLIMRVIDNGIGIPPDRLSHVFEPFTQIDDTLARRYEGTGLGLYFSRALVQAHGGMLTLESVVGEGTTAEIRIPPRRLAPPRR